MYRLVRQVAAPGGGGAKNTVSDCILFEIAPNTEHFAFLQDIFLL